MNIVTQDFDFGGTSGGQYIVGPNAYVEPGIPSGIDRTRAWHQFAITCRPDGVVFRVDGILVLTDPRGLAIDKLNVNMFGPSWRPAWVSYFDDFEYVPYEVNTAPTLAVTGPALATAGVPATYSFATTDDSAGPFAYAIAWGDGTTQSVSAGAALSLDHTYATPGSYTISATVTDPGNLTSPAATLAVAVQPPLTDTLVLTGTDGSDVIFVVATGPRAVTSYVNGVRSLHQGVSRVVAHGLGGDDVLAAAGSLPVQFFGGPGNDTLFGGFANDVLAGGPGSDALYGSTGNDILVGGTGGDFLFGGFGDDLLIGGSAAFIDDGLAIAAVQAEWTSARPYAERVANLRGDASSPSFDQRLNGTTYLRGSGSNPTVFDDAASDYLSGQAGRDWYFARPGADFVWIPDPDELTDPV